MGTLIYGQTAVKATFEDRMLAHLRAVIVNKLRRGESFLFTWTSETKGFKEQHSAWMHPAVALSFTLDAASAAPLNQEWLALLAEAANSTSGLGPHREPNTTPVKRQSS